MRAWSGASFFAIATLVMAGAACKDEPPQPLECREAQTHPDLVASTRDDVQVVVDVATSSTTDRLVEDLGHYLSTLWGSEPVTISRGPPDFSTAQTILVSTSSLAFELVGEPALSTGYVLRSVPAPVGGGRVHVVYAKNDIELAYGVYAFLEVLGVRFFHPLEERVPRWGSVLLPEGLDVVARSPYRVRGIQLHLLHPIEYFSAFNGGSEADFEVARTFIDWLVKTGQNHVQWPIMRTMPLDSWRAHAQRVVEYAHARGVSVGVAPLLFGRSALQNNFVLAGSAEDWRIEMSANLDWLLQVPWDLVELGLGEFLANDPAELLAMLDFVVDHVKTAHPEVEVSVVNHVGDFPELWVEWGGDTEYFYFLPRHADTRLINTVHTVFFYDLYREGGMYGHESFAGHRAFLLEELARRRVRYMPESAYWVSADVDVPIFLPEFVQARWVDIHRLDQDIRAMDLPYLDGHIMFSSGHEWGYWMTDYLSARMLWRPDLERDALLSHYAAAYGSCAPEALDVLRRFIDLQSDYLFDRKLISYLHGEDLHDDLGAIAGYETHRPRVPFERLLEMSRDDRAELESKVVGALERFAEEAAPLEAKLDEMCEHSDADIAPWCRELLDGVAIVRLRALHSASLYRAVLSAMRAQSKDAQSALDLATDIRRRARAVIDRRSRDYRFPMEVVAAAYENPTIYKFGYLYQAHSMCFWERQAAQARHVVVHREASLVVDLPTCVE